MYEVIGSLMFLFICFSYLFPKTPRMIPYPAAECKRGIPLIFETGKTNQSGNLPTHSAPAKLSETTLMIFRSS